MINLKLIGIDDNWPTDALYGFGAGGLFIILQSVSSISIGIPAPIYPQSATMSAYLISVIASMVIIGGLAPAGEEALFRGAFLFLSENLPLVSLVDAVVLTGAAFSLFHWKVYGMALQAAFVGAFIFSTLACGLALQTKSLLPGMIMHSMVNLYLYIQSADLLTVGGI